MAVHPVRLFGDPVLRTPTEPVTVFDSRLATVVENLFDTVEHEGGAGLAAPQIGMGVRVFVYTCAGRRGHVVNPVWRALDDGMQEGPEGCLSIPGVTEPTNRHRRVHVTGQDVDGRPVEFDCEDLLARAVQHETDHLDGVLFLQRLEPEHRRDAMGRIRRSTWFGCAAISRDRVFDDLADAMAEVG